MAFYWIAGWGRSGEAALAGFGGRAEMDIHQIARLPDRSQRATQRIGMMDGPPQAKHHRPTNWSAESALFTGFSTYTRPSGGGSVTLTRIARVGSVCSDHASGFVYGTCKLSRQRITLGLGSGYEVNFQVIYKIRQSSTGGPNCKPDMRQIHSVARRSLALE
jgi:hypothetical protein